MISSLFRVTSAAFFSFVFSLNPFSHSLFLDFKTDSLRMTAVTANGKVTEKHENGVHANGTSNGTSNGTAVQMSSPQPVYYTPPENLDTFELTLRKHFEEKHNLKFGKIIFKNVQKSCRTWKIDNGSKTVV